MTWQSGVLTALYQIIDTETLIQSKILNSPVDKENMVSDKSNFLLKSWIMAVGSLPVICGY